MNYKKPPKVGSSSAIRQMRGPGMNKGLKKPRYGQFPKGGSTESRSTSAPVQGKKPSPTEKPSYLSKTLVPTGRSRTPSRG